MNVCVGEDEQFCASKLVGHGAETETDTAVGEGGEEEADADAVTDGEEVEFILSL